MDHSTMKRLRPPEEDEISPNKKEQNDPNFDKKDMENQCSRNHNNESMKRNYVNSKQEHMECEQSNYNEDSADIKQNYFNGKQEQMGCKRSEFSKDIERFKRKNESNICFKTVDPKRQRTPELESPILNTDKMIKNQVEVLDTFQKRVNRSKHVIHREFEVGGLEAIKSLVEDGEDKNHLLINVVNCKPIEEMKKTVKYLLNIGASADFAIKDAISYGDVELVEIFLDAGAETNNALWFAVQKLLCGKNPEVGNNDKNIICLLLARGADVDAQCEAAKMSILQMVFNKGANRLIEVLVGSNRADEVNQKWFKCLQTLSDTFRGYLYQIILTTLIALRTVFKNYKIGSEVANALGFDDIVLMTVNQAETNNCQFVQIKQTKKIDITKIMETDLVSMLGSKKALKKYLKGDFSFLKNFMNFNEILLKSSYTNMKSVDFFICTNMTFLKASSPYYKSTEIANDFFHGLGQPYRLQNAKLFMLEVKFVLLNMIDVNAILHIQIDEKKEELEQQIKQVDNIVHHIKRTEINMDTRYEETNLWPISKIITVGLEHLTDYLNYVTKCTENISKAKDMEEIIKNIPKECKRPDFTKNLNDTKKDSYNAIKDVINRMIANKDFFEKFTGWTEEYLQSRIDEFLKKFTLLTNCPNTLKLNKIITEELGDQFKLSNSQFLTDHIVRDVENWISSFVNEQAEYLMSDHLQKSFDHLSSLVNSLKVTGVTESYIETIKMSSLCFEYDHPQLLHFLNSTNSSLLHIITDHTRLNVMKVLQTLSNFECKERNFKYNDSFLLINIEHLKSSKCSKNILTAFSSDISHHLLVIEFPDESNEFENLNNVIDSVNNILRQNVDKKLITIANRDCIFVSKLKNLHMNYNFYYEHIMFKDLVAHSMNIVLEKNITFQSSIALQSGNTMKLNDFIDLNTACEKIHEDILSVIIDTQTNIIIDDSKQVPKELNECNLNYFIPRTMHKQFMKSDIFKCFKNNLFFVTGMSEESLYDAINDRNITVHIWEEGKSFELGIILPPKQLTQNINKANAEIFKIICDTCGKRNSDEIITNNIFWLEYQQDYLIWKGLKFDSSYPYEFIDKYSNGIVYPNKETQIDRMKNLFVLPEDVDEKVVILANNSGGGKSSVLTYFAHTIHMKYPCLWIVRVNLRHYTNDNASPNLNSIDFNENNTLRAIETLTRMIFQYNDTDSNMALQKQLFLSVVSGSAKTEVIVLFDGFDEICPEYKDKTCILLKALKNCAIRQLWITTTDEWKPLLEQQLQTPAFMLTTFSKPQQIDLLNKFWKYRLKFIHDNETKLEDIKKYINECLDVHLETKCNLYFDKYLKRSFQHLKDFFIKNSNGTIKELRKVIDAELDFSKYAELLISEWSASICDLDLTFSTVPLHVTMLAENIFQKYMNIATFKTLNLFKIYKQFVDDKLKIYQQKGSTHSGNHIDKDQASFATLRIRNMHSELAVRQRFRNVKVMLEETLNEIEKIRRIGFIKDTETGPEFMHYSFADFFCYEYLTIHFDKKMVQLQLLEQILLDSNRRLMQKFFNAFLSQNKKRLYKSTWKKILKLQNDRKESALQIASKAGNMEICMLLLNSANERQNISKNFLLNEDYRRETALHSIVVAEDNIEVFVLYFKLVKKYPDELSKMIMTSNTNGRTVFEKATEKGKTFICKIILEYFKEYFDLNDLLSRRDSDGRSILYYAIKSSRQSCDLIIKYATGCGHLLKYMIKHCQFKNFNDGMTQYEITELPRSLVKNCRLSALHIAVYFANRDVCALIFETAKKYFSSYQLILICDHFNQTVLHIAARNNSEICHWIFEVAELDPSVPARLMTRLDSLGQAPLHKAVQFNNREICELILQKAKLHDVLAYVLTIYDLDKRSPLHLAVNNGFTEIYRQILEYARRVMSKNEMQDLLKERDRLGRTILHTAASVSVDIFQLVFQTTKDIEGVLEELTARPDKYGRTVMHTAVEAGKIEVCKLIFRNIGRSQFQSCDSKGNSILHSAVLIGSTEMCTYVLNTSGQYLETMMKKLNYSGDTVLHLAIKQSYKICKLILKSANRHTLGFLLTHCNNGFKQTALHIAVTECETQACNLIMKYALRYNDMFRDMVEKLDAKGCISHGYSVYFMYIPGYHSRKRKREVLVFVSVKPYVGKKILTF